MKHDLNHLREAATLLSQYVRKTPVLPSLTFSGIWMKTENLQVTGSFKIRTALNQLLRLSPAQKARGIVTSSSGNFAGGTAYASELLGLSAKIVMMESSNPVKIERVLKHQAAIAFCGNTFRDRQEKVEAIQEEEGRTVIYPFDHNDAILGSATVGLEILEQFQDMRRVVTPVSGGGLISGIALAVKQSNPDIEIIGVQPRGSNATTRSFNEGTKITLEKSNTVADGLRVTEPGSITFPLIQQFVDEMVEVSEDSIKAATSRIIFQEKLLVEPSGAVPLAAVLEGKVKSDNTLLVLSGGNIDPEFLKLLSREYQTKISRRKPFPQLD